jgi:hypothetical protein
MALHQNPVSRANRDIYAHLFDEARGLRDEQVKSRELWLDRIPWNGKSEALFEFEMLLKGLICFGNPKNIPGSQGTVLPGSYNFQSHAHVIRDSLDRIISLIRKLLGSRDRTYTFSRYLESVLPQDLDRTRIAQEHLSQVTPEDSLASFRHAFGGLRELSDALLQLDTVSHRYFGALHSSVIREIERNTFFNPLVTIEFRHEYDRIRMPQILEALQLIPFDTAHRVVALTFLTLFRVLRYLRLIDEYALDPSAGTLTYPMWAVARSDLGLLTQYLSSQAHRILADGVENEILQIPAREASNRHSDLMRATQTLASLGNTLDSVSLSLQRELRELYDIEIPAPHHALGIDEFSFKVRECVISFRTTLHSCIRALHQEFCPGVAVDEFATDREARVNEGERLRLEAWMFSQVLRAFIAKASAAAEYPDKWSGSSDFQFVKDFLNHFKAIGYQLVRMSDYKRLDPFLEVLEDLRDADLLDPSRIQAAVEESQVFREYLLDLVKQISRRAELIEVPFDKKRAADHLKRYLETYT